jgi:sorbitol-6-phosphate 2-dehydrogenase
MTAEACGWLGLQGKTALVTGGAAGIGRACAEGLAEVDVNIVIADVNEEAGQRVADDIRQTAGVETLFVSADVTSKASVDKLITAVLDRFGGVEILINNAGILIPRLLVDPEGEEELTEEIWDKVVAINQKGIFLCAQAVARVMIKSGRGGVIINMSSESGLEGSEGQSVYAATKGAIYAMTRSWAKELGKHGIRVVGVAPGIVEATALRSDEYERAVAYTRGVSVEEFREKYEQVSIPVGRVGKLAEVANVVTFLASDRAGYVHGTTINISGGKSRG